MFTVIIVSVLFSALIAMFVFPYLMEVNEGIVAQKKHLDAVEAIQREIDDLIEKKMADLRQAVIEEGLVCKMYHEFPCYWPSKK